LAQDLQETKKFPHVIHQLAWILKVEKLLQLNLFNVTI